MNGTIAIVVSGALLVASCGSNETASSTSVGAGSGGAGSGSGGAGGGANHACVGATCTGTQVCVAHRTVGGGLVEPDANGECPSGAHLEPLGGSEYCVADFAYECVELVGCSAGQPITCACASPPGDTKTCPTPYDACGDPQPDTAWLDPLAQLICEQQAP